MGRNKWSNSTNEWIGGTVGFPHQPILLHLRTRSLRRPDLNEMSFGVDDPVRRDADLLVKSSLGKAVVPSRGRAEDLDGEFERFDLGP